MNSIPSPKPPKEKPDLAVAKIKFRFLYVSKRGRWSCAKLSHGEARNIADKLKHYRQMTVAQFRQSSGVRLKNINRGLPPAPDELSEDVKNQLAQEIRVSRRSRVLGYLMEDEFFVIWLDPDHSVTG